jgi:hypothetical protein
MRSHPSRNRTLEFTSAEAALLMWVRSMDKATERQESVRHLHFPRTEELPPLRGWLNVGRGPAPQSLPIEG